METCDVLIVGGGPAGSSCAWKLHQAGVDVIVIDQKQFPRDKVCAGWLTPPVLDELALDIADYQRSRTIQPITRFITGMIGGTEVETDYHQTVSYGIRRCEFDDYLLRRSGAKLRLKTAFKSLKRDANDWVLNDGIRATVVIGAGGHFCPVARQFASAKNAPNSHQVDQPTVLAQESEFEMDEDQLQGCAVQADRPELFFCPDLKGYGWVFRKGNFVNIGLGREDETRLGPHLDRFIQFLASRGKFKSKIDHPFHGHAYRLRTDISAKNTPDGILLIGDSFGLAAVESGEGIRPAVESGLLAAATILEWDRNCRSELAERYHTRIRSRFGESQSGPAINWVPTSIKLKVARWLMRSHYFARRVLLNRWFLRLGQPALQISISDKIVERAAQMNE